MYVIFILIIVINQSEKELNSHMYFHYTATRPVFALTDEKNGRPHGTPTRQNSRRSEGGADRCEWVERGEGGALLQRRGSAKERTRLLSSNGTQSQP